jgi:hypothetical protein
MTVSSCKGGSQPVQNAFDTHIPYIGQFDYQNPVDLFAAGGVLLTLLSVEGLAKWIIIAGIVVARYEWQKRYPA